MVLGILNTFIQKNIQTNQSETILSGTTHMKCHGDGTMLRFGALEKYVGWSFTTQLSVAFEILA